MKFTLPLVLFAICLFSSCSEDELIDCIPPPCAQPDINYAAQLLIRFCTEGANCFSAEELELIYFIEDTGNTPTATDTAAITDLANRDFTILVGGGGPFLFGPEEDNLTAVAYRYKIVIPEGGLIYSIDQLTFEPTGVCECPSNQFTSGSLNGLATEIVNNELVITK